MVPCALHFVIAHTVQSFPTWISHQKSSSLQAFGGNFWRYCVTDGHWIKMFILPPTSMSHIFLKWSMRQLWFHIYFVHAMCLRTWQRKDKFSHIKIISSAYQVFDVKKYDTPSKVPESFTSSSRVPCVHTLHSVIYWHARLDDRWRRKGAK